MHDKQITVLIADDSEHELELFFQIIQSEPDLRVIGKAKNGKEAVDMAISLRPDVVIMDLVMPKLNGFEATRQIMNRAPTRIIIVSGVFNKKEMLKALETLDAGAMTVIEKPKWVNDAQYLEAARLVTKTIRSIAGIKIENTTLYHYAKTPIINERTQVDIIAIGASLGGPPALLYILSKLPTDYPIPILIQQQIGPKFVVALAEWLNTSTSLTVTVAKDGEKALPGHAYLTDENTAMEININGFITTKKADKESPVDTLFESIAKAYESKCAAIWLKGMSKDGVKGIQALKEQNAIIITQDICVHQMPLKTNKDETIKIETNFAAFENIVKILMQLAKIPQQL